MFLLLLGVSVLSLILSFICVVLECYRPSIFFAAMAFWGIVVLTIFGIISRF